MLKTLLKVINLLFPEGDRSTPLLDLTSFEHSRNFKHFIKSHYKDLLILFILFFVGLVFRFYHINFGLPHSFHADEPEIVEPAIKYTFELKSIIQNGDYYKFIPVSFVYGTFPTYVNTLLVMLYSKSANLLGIAFDKTTLYILSRGFVAILNASLIFLTYFLYVRITKTYKGALLTAFLFALNWNQIVLSHYVNQDAYTVFLQLLTLYLGYRFFDSEIKTPKVILLGVLVGFLIGTKITAIIILPLFLLPFIVKKDVRSLTAFLFIVFGAFCLSNPFSIIFFQDFMLRIVEMFTKEAGVVIDSYDPTFYKYFLSLENLLTSFLLILSVLGILQFSFKKEVSSYKKIYLIGFVVIYIVFFSISSRRIDRWVGPIVPLLLIFSSYYLANLSRKVGVILMFMSIMAYLYKPVLLLYQYQRFTPKSEAYLWLQKNTSTLDRKFVLTEEGLDPINKLPNSASLVFNQYESEGAFLTFPPNPYLYDYIILSSKSLDSYKKDFIQKEHHYYFEKWKSFETIVTTSSDFENVYEKSIPKPNLINVSDVYVYKKVR